MNPLIVLFAVYLMSSEKNTTRPVFDTFQMELTLDNISRAVNMIQKVNGLGKSAMSLTSQQPTAMLTNSSSNQSIPDFSEMMKTMGPLLKILAASSNNAE